MRGQNQQTVTQSPVLPKWEQESESPEQASYILNYKVIPCMEFQDGNCCNRHCFNYHSDSEMRRPVVNSDGHVLYWDAICQFLERGQTCPYGYGCSFAHSEDERNYHPGQYKATVSKAKDYPSLWDAVNKKERRSGAHKYQYKVPRPVEVHSPHTPHAQPAATDGMPSSYKFRFCAYYPTVENCRRKEFCSFAHTREEIRAPLLTPKEETKRDLSNPFFTERFKIHWCPIGVQHDWQTCVYAHNYQDARRDPAIGYGPRPCPYWEKKDRAPSYESRCPHGFRCPYAHGAKEQLYHPGYFKTVVCWDYNQGTKGCPRGNLCAFYHKKKLQRKTLEDVTDYNNSLTEEQMLRIQQHFQSPPFFSGDDKDALAMGLSRRRQQDWVAPVAPVQAPVFVPQSEWSLDMHCSPMGSPMGSPGMHPMSPDAMHMGTPLMVGEQPANSMMYMPQSPTGQFPDRRYNQGFSPLGSPQNMVGMMMPVFPALDQNGDAIPGMPHGYPMREFHPELPGMFSLVPVDSVPPPPALALPRLSGGAQSDGQQHTDALRRAERKHREEPEKVQHMRKVQSMSTADGSNSASQSDVDSDAKGQEPNYNSMQLEMPSNVPFFVDDE